MVVLVFMKEFPCLSSGCHFCIQKSHDCLLPCRLIVLLSCRCLCYVCISVVLVIIAHFDAYCIYALDAAGE